MWGDKQHSGVFFLFLVFVDVLSVLTGFLRIYSLAQNRVFFLSLFILFVGFLRNGFFPITYNNGINSIQLLKKVDRMSITIFLLFQFLIKIELNFSKKEKESEKFFQRNRFCHFSAEQPTKQRMEINLEIDRCQISVDNVMYNHFFLFYFLACQQN